MLADLKDNQLNFLGLHSQTCCKIYVAQLSICEQEGDFYKRNFCRGYSNFHLQSLGDNFGG